MELTAASQAYRDRHADAVGAEYFRSVGDCALSSIGIGTYLGEPTDAVDDRYEEAVVTALESGCTVLDTAINYRHQRSERVVGRAIDTATVDRDAVFVATKGGFLSFDGDRPADPGAYVRREYVEPGLLAPEDLAAGSHCIAPTFLDDQLERSLANLNLASVDLYYVHNPETQLRERSPDAVYDALEEAFVVLEERAEAGDLARYGIATWDALRVPPGHDSHLSLSTVCERAQAAADRVGVAESRFGAIQLPFNAAMPEAHVVDSQAIDGERVSALAAAQAHDLAVFTSASLAQGALAEETPPALEAVPGETAVERALTFARSAPGVTSALVGSSRAAHVEANLRAGAADAMADAAFSEVVSQLDSA